MENLMQNNKHLLCQWYHAAKAIDALLLAWNTMNTTVGHLSYYCKSQVFLHNHCLFNTFDEETIKPILQEITGTSDMLFQIHNKNMEQIHETEAYVSPLVQEFHCANQNAAAKVSQPLVTISAKTMLEELLLQLDAPSPTYISTPQLDGEIVAQCAYYTSINYPSDAEPDIKYGLPFPTYEQAIDSTARTALKNIDAQNHIQLFDYNYNAKEAMVDKNRELIAKLQNLTTAVIEIYNILDRESLYDLQSLIGRTEAIISNLTLLANAHLPGIPTHSVMRFIESIHIQLFDSHAVVLQVLTMYEGIVTMSINKSCHIV